MILPNNYSFPILAIAPQKQQQEQLIQEWRERYPIVLDISQEENEWDLSVLAQKFDDPAGGIINLIGRSVYQQNSLLIPIEALKNYWKILLLIDNRSLLLKTLESRVQIVDLSSQQEQTEKVHLENLSIQEFISTLKDLDNTQFLQSLQTKLSVETFAWCSQLLEKGARKEWIATAIYHDIIKV